MPHLDDAPRFTDRGRPVVVVAFDGWSDAGSAATGAVDHLAETNASDVLGILDTDDFYDYQVTRPQVLGQGAGRRVTWPGVTVRACTVDGRELLLVTGPEPSFRWRTFADAVVAMVAPHDPQGVVVLGSYLGSEPHTRPVGLSDSSQEPTYEGPIGIGAVVAQAFTDAGVTVSQLWATVPHYLSTEPYVAASLALLGGVADLTGADVPTRALRAVADSERERHDAEVADEPDLTEYVAELEQRYDATHAGEDIGDAVEQFLRGQA